ncbi:hypothetical protein [Nostoc sp.]
MNESFSYVHPPLILVNESFNSVDPPLILVNGCDHIHALDFSGISEL